MLRSLLACGFVVSWLGTDALRAADPWEMRQNLTTSDFEKASKDFTEKGYRLTQISAAAVGKDKELRFLAVWEKRSDAPESEARHNLTAKEYEKRTAELKDKGFRPVEVCGYEASGEPRFAAIWEKAPKDALLREAHHALTSDDYRTLYAALANKGYRPLRLTGYQVGKETYYTTVWEKEPKGAPTWHTRRDLTADQYQEVFNAQVKDGYHLAHVTGYTINGEERFACVWEKSATKVGWQGRHAMDANKFELEAARLKELRHRPLNVNSHVVKGELRYVGVWVQD